jgi:ribose transport system substrate-binding protein
MLGMVVALMVVACGGDGSGGAGGASGQNCADRSLNRTPPPSTLEEIDWTHEVGEPTWYTDVDLSADQIRQLCEMQPTAVFTNVVSGEAIEPFRDGIVAAFDDVGIELVAEAYAEFDPAKQTSDVENAMALNPDLVLGLPVDPVSGAQAYQPVVDSETCLVLGGVEPEGYEVGEDYYSQVTFDLPGLGELGAEALAEAVGGDGTVGYIVHDADFFITNTRDDAALEHLSNEYPNIEVLTAPMADPAKTEDIARAMITRNPQLEAILAPWSAGPATGVIAAVHDLGREDIKVVTFDLDPTVALSMAEGGPVYRVVGSLTYEFGYTWAVAGMQCLLGLPTPTVAILPAIQASAENVHEVWPLVFGPKIPLPEDVEAALAQG